MRCKCRKTGSECGPGCHCRDCCNTSAPENVQEEIAESSDSESDEDTNIEIEVITGLEYDYEDMIEMQT